MQHNVLIVERDAKLASLLIKQVKRAGLQPIVADSLTAAKSLYQQSIPETILCALVGYEHNDAPAAHAINYLISISIPTIAVSAKMTPTIRKAVMQYPVVDYIGMENTQTTEYLFTLLQRLNKNKSLGVILYSATHRVRKETKSLLQRHSFQTYTCQTMEQVKNALLTHKHIRMAMLDAGTPSRDLADFVSDLRSIADKDQLAIVGLSAKLSDFHAAHFIKCGATDFFELPFDHEEFMCRIIQLLEAIEHVELIRLTANQDYLTGLPNRRHFFYSVNQLLPSQISQQALAILDLDHFKRINDKYGHDAGDKVLQRVAQLIATQFEHAHIARLGGEEFCIYLPDVNPENAIQQLENLRQTVSQASISFMNHTIKATTSIGLTIADNSNVKAMLTKADKLLYKAKQQGRNCVVHDFNLPALDAR